MTANSTRRSASHTTLAPTSRTEVTPRKVGQLATRAGRSMSPAIRSNRRDIAIRAPVLPAETAAVDSPERTLSTAFHMEVSLPRRMACAGLASLLITPVAGRTSLTLATSGKRASTGFNIAGSPCNRNWTAPPGMAFKARATPGTTTVGPWSPPMASIEITKRSGTAALSAPNTDRLIQGGRTIQPDARDASGQPASFVRRRSPVISAADRAKLKMARRAAFRRAPQTPHRVCEGRDQGSGPRPRQHRRRRRQSRLRPHPQDHRRPDL